MYELINDLVALQSKKAAKAKCKPKSSYSLRKLVLELAAEANSNVPVERHITPKSVITVAERSLNKTAKLEKQTRIFTAYRDVASFVLFAVSGHTAGVVANTDLLPIGHPYATRKHRMSDFSLQEARARWIAADPRIDNSVREIVASAYSYPLGSEEQIHACSRLAAASPTLVPRDIVLDAPTQALVAVAGFGLGGNSSAARSVRARLQRRDRNGQFAEQGGGLKFYLRKPNGSVVSVTGKFAGNALDSNDFIVEVKNDPVLKDGLYKVPTFKSEAVEAYLPGKKGAPEVAVSLPAGVDAVNLTELGPIDSPDGWDVVSVKKEGDKGPDKIFKSGDGYIIEYYAPGNEDIKSAIQKAWKYNTPMGSGLSEPPSVKNADGQTGLQAKLSKDDPVFIMYRDDTDLTKKKSVAIAQDWSDIQDFAAADEKGFDADYAKAKASKEKLEKADEESKAKLDELQKKQAELDAQNAEVRAELEALALQGKDVNGNDVPEGWTALRNDSALYPTSGKTIDKNKAFGFVREEQGVSMNAFFDDEGKLDLNGQKFDSWDDLEAAIPDYVKGKIDETRNAAKEAIKPYDDEDGYLAGLIDAGSSGEEMLEELDKVPSWKAAMEDLDTSWAVDLPSKSQKDSWAKLQKTINTIKSMKPQYVDKTEPGLSEKKKGRLSQKIAEMLKKDIFDKDTLPELQPLTRSELDSLDEETKIKIFNPDPDAVDRYASPWETAQPKKKVKDTKPKILKIDPEKELLKRDGIQMLKVKGPDGKEVETPVVNVNGRPMVLVDVNGVRVPFYISTGSGGKKNVAVGKWYPIFGLGEDGWFNKGFEGQINSYYDVPEFQEIAEWLDNNIGDIRNNKNLVKKDSQDDDLRAQINADLSPGRFYDPDLTDANMVLVRARISGDSAKIAEAEKDVEAAKAEVIARKEERQKMIDSLEKAAKAPAAEEEPFDFIVPPGAYKLQLASFEPEGRTDQDSKDYTEDPKVLANKFTEKELTDALAQALTGEKDFAADFLDKLAELDEEDEEDTGKKKKTGPKPKKPEKPKGVASGYGALDFSQGEEFIPAEALYLALEEYGIDPRLTVAQIYDAMLGESKNVDMLSGVGKEENVKGIEPSILDSDDIESIENMIDLNAKLAQPDSSSVATAMINELSKNEDDNPRINEMVEALDAFKGPDGYIRALDQFIEWALNGDEDQKQAYRGLHALLISGDGGYAAPGEDSEFKTAVGKAIEKYTGSPASPSDIEKVFEEFGYWTDLLDSKKKLLTEEESINDKFSTAGSFYRLIAQMQKPNELELYRGMQLEENSDALKNITEKGAIISLDPRSFSIDKGIAGKFSGALTAKPAKGMNSVIITLRKGQGDSVDISGLSPFSDEQEHLVAGDFRITEVRKKITPNGHTLYNVSIEKISEREAVLEGYKNNYEEFLLENQQVDLPEGYYTPSSEPYTPMEEKDASLPDEFDDSPLTIARMWEKDDLIEVYRAGIEDGSGKVILEYPIDDGYEATIDVEAVRDALQIQGIDTNELMNDIANASSDAKPSDEQPEAAESNVNDDVLQIAEEVGSEWDMEGWKQVGPQLGSNKGGFYEDKDGDRFYVKEAKSDLHAQNEALASALYRALGINAAEIYMGSAADGKKKTFSPDIPDSKQDLQEKLKDKDYLAKLQEGFAVDAWLANWDVAGLVFDNVMSDGDGNPVRVDPGGALLFRAMGAPKGKLFGNEVNELDSLRDPNMNPQSASIFGSMTDEQQKESARKLLDISHDDIDTMVDTIIEDSDVANGLKDTLKARRQFILERYDLLSEDTSIIAETNDISDQDADVQEAKAADTVESRLETLLDWADEYGGDEGNYVEYNESKEKFKEIAKQVDAALVDYRNGDITDEQMPETLQKIEDLILSFEWDSNSGTSDELAWSNVDDLVSQIEKIRSTFYAPKPEDTPKPTVEPATDAVVNPYITSDGMPIDPGMKVKYNKTGATGTVIKYDKGNTNYVYVQMDGETKPKVKSTKQLSSMSEKETQKPSTPEVHPQVKQAQEDSELSPLELPNGVVDNAFIYKQGRMVWNDLQNNWVVRDDAEGKNLGTADTVEDAKSLIDANGSGGKGAGPKAPEPSPAPESVEPDTTEPSQLEIAEKDIQLAPYTTETGSVGINSFIYESETAEGLITWEKSSETWRVAGKDKSEKSTYLDNVKTVEEAKDLIEKFAAGEISVKEKKPEVKEDPEPKTQISLWDQENAPSVIGEDKVGVRILVDSGDVENFKGDGPSNLSEVGVNYVKSEGYTDDGMYYAEVELPLDKMDEFTKSWNNMLKEMAGPYGNPDYVEPQQFFGGIYDDYKTSIEAEKQDKEVAEAEAFVLDTTGSVEDLSGQIAAAIAQKQDITFNYNGKTRVVTPMSIWTNPKNGNINLYGIDKGDGDKKKNFTLQYIESAPDQKPTPLAEKVSPQEAPQNIPADEVIPETKKLQLHAQWVKDILEKKGTKISDKKAEEIRDAIDENDAIDGWSGATDDDIYNAILDVVAPGFVDLEEDTTSKEPKVPVAPEGEMKISDVNGNDVFKGVEITDKKGNKGTVLKVNKDNYALVEFADGSKGWRSANTISTTGEVKNITSLKTFAPKKGKVTPAGTEAIIVESPNAWDTSEFEGAPSLLDAMEIVQTPGSKKAPMRGASAAVDSDSIEDLDVRVMKVRNTEGEDSLQFKFKLTAWAGNAKAKQLLSLPSEELAANGITRQPNMNVDRLDIGEDGVGQISKVKSAYSANGGYTWSITTEDGIVVKIHRANRDATSKTAGGSGRAFHNLVTITAPAGATQEQVAKALSLAGVQDVRPATQKDARVLIENRLMSVLDAKTDATKNLSGTERAESLARIEKKYGITPDDVTVTTGASGRLETRLTPEAAQKIVDATGNPEALQHNLSIPYNITQGGNEAYIDWVVNLLSNPQEGLLSTTTRWTEGIGTSGMSSAADVGTGGADYVFTRPMKSADAKKFGTGGLVMYFDPNKVYQRLDFYANYNDAFGKRQSSQDVISAAKVGAYEVMFKQRLGWEDLDVVVVKSELIATEIKDKLRAKGVESLGGKSLDEAIIYIKKETKD